MFCSRCFYLNFRRIFVWTELNASQELSHCNGLHSTEMEQKNVWNCEHVSKNGILIWLCSDTNRQIDIHMNNLRLALWLSTCFSILFVFFVHLKKFHFSRVFPLLLRIQCFVVIRIPFFSVVVSCFVVGVFQLHSFLFGFIWSSIPFVILIWLNIWRGKSSIERKKRAKKTEKIRMWNGKWNGKRDGAREWQRVWEKMITWNHVFAMRRMHFM